MHSESSADFSHCEALDLWQGLAQQRSEPFRVVGTHRVADRDVQWPLSVRAPRQGARKLAHDVAPAKTHIRPVRFLPSGVARMNGVTCMKRAAVCTHAGTRPPRTA